MYIVVGKENSYIRIRGEGFTAYVDSIYSFYRLIKALGVKSVSFDQSLNTDLLLKEQLTLQLQNRDFYNI